MLTVEAHSFFRKTRDTGFYEVYDDEELTLYLLNEALQTDIGLQMHAYGVQLHAGVKSPYVAPFVSEGVHDGRPYLLLRTIPGERLSVLLERAGGRAPVELVCEVARQTGRALEALNCLEVDGAPCAVVHGSLSPECIHIGLDGRARLLELELSESILAPRQDEGVVIGRPGYFAPEHLHGTRVPEGDLFSLALSLLAMMGEGESPLHDDNVMDAIFRLRAFDVSELMLSGPLASVLERCLAQDVSERFRSPATFVDALPALHADLGAWARGVLDL